MLGLGIAFALRIGFLVLQINRLDRLWDDFDRRALSYQLAQLLDLLTILGDAICAGYVLWLLPGNEIGIVVRYG